jgi:ferritin-like metal-binding protein YciE
MAESPRDTISRYLQDAIAAERSFESQLEGFSKEGDNEAAKSLFAQHAAETRNQYERLTARLEALGGSPSTSKSVLAHMFGLAPKSASMGHEKEERTSQNLMIAFSVESAECAMYEALANSAALAGDRETEALARAIQTEEKQTADKVWALIPAVSREAFQRVAGSGDVARGAAI